MQKEKAQITESIDDYQKLERLLEDFNILAEYTMDGDVPSGNEALGIYAELDEEMRRVEIKVLLSGEFDSNNCIVAINAGAGGTESCDWAAMLQRMIIRWAEGQKFKVSIVDVQGGESAGIKSTTMTVEGSYAFGLLKSEIGIHRLVRISPFDANAKRHTSFASIFVTPEVEDEVEIEILDKDLRIDVYRSGGAGGQSVNTTDSAVRITHYPSGIVVTCQNERSQLQNKLQAMKILKSRLYEMEMDKRRAQQDATHAQKKEIAWGSQIRSYVLHPYQLVKDHRSQHETSNAEKVLDGFLDPFMDAFLRWEQKKNEMPA